jgi:hypothetical protein
MTTTIRRLIILALGLLSGLAVWPIMETLVYLQADFPSFLSFTVFSGALFGLVFGAFFASAEGIISGNKRRIRRATLVGAGIGLLGGILGFLAGQAALFILGEMVFGRAREVTVYGLPLARAIGWALLGLFVGAAEGFRARSRLKIGMGVAGGFLGGLAGGAAIEYLRLVLPGVALSRLLGLLAFGLLISLFYALIERRLSHGVLRILNGGRKGTEFILNQQRFSVGGAPTNDIILTGYRNVADHHARIWAEGGELQIAPADGSQVVVNDEPVKHTRLRYEDVIKIGTAKLFYRPE